MSERDRETDDGPWLEEEEAGCRLLFRTGSLLAGDLVAPLSASCAGIVAPSGPAIDGWQQLAAQAQLALIVERDTRLAKRISADGVLLEGAKEAEHARSTLGDDRLIGVCCPLSRHDLMLAGEAGADYLLVGDPDKPVSEKLLALVAWWAEMFVLPLAVTGRLDAQSGRELAAAGAGFLVIEAPILRDGAALSRIADTLD